VILDSRWHYHVCPYSLCRLSSWKIFSERKNLGFLFAVDHGAEEVVDLAQGGDLPSTHPMEGYFSVTYPTGLLWNPYPSMLGVPDIWPENFPTQLREIKQEVLNEAMERVPAASIGIVQSLPAPNPQPKTILSPSSPLLALGLKTFAPLTEGTTLFTKSALWSLFLPNNETSALLRGLLVQPLLWRLGLHTAFSLPMSSQETGDGSHSKGDIDVRLLRVLRQTNLTTCATVASCLNLIYSQHHKDSLPQLEAWLFDLVKIGYQAPQLRPHRQFAYLTQGAALSPTSNPRLKNLSSNISSSSFDIFYLSFSNNGSGDLFFPKSTFQQGRNALLRLALSMEISPGYAYFVFTDEDVQLTNVNNPSLFWKTNMSADPWVRMEEFLLKFRPMVGFGRYDNWVQTKNNSGIFSITTTHDQCLVAYSRHTLDFGQPLIESYLDKLSSWNQGLMLKFLEKVIYSKAAFQINSIKTVNKGSKYHSAQYKQGFNLDKVSKFMLSNLNTNIEKNPLLKIFNNLLDRYRAKKEVYSYGEMELNTDTFILSKSAQNTFGKYFEPEMLKYFNICGQILQNQQRWWRSALLFTEQNPSIARIIEQMSIECSK